VNDLIEDDLAGDENEVSMSDQLRGLMEESTVQAPGAPSPLLGKMIERMGYEAVYLSAANVAENSMALPIDAKAKFANIAQQAKYLAKAVSIPIILDLANALGQRENLSKELKQLEDVGVAAVIWNDHDDAGLTTKQLQSATSVTDLVLGIRTSALDRVESFRGEGAELVVITGLTSKKEFENVIAQTDTELIAEMAEFSDNPLLTAEELSELGFAVIIYPDTLLRITLKAAEAALATLGAEGSQAELLEIMMKPAELTQLRG